MVSVTAMVSVSVNVIISKVVGSGVKLGLWYRYG